jgi:type II secretory pathway pseudopilin PulG
MVAVSANFAVPGRAARSCPPPAPGAHRARAVRRRGGFTILEVLLVVALLAATATLFLVSFDSLARTTPEETIEAVFWSALRDAREHALRTRQPVQVFFDAEQFAFVLAGAQPFRTVRVPVNEWPSGLEVGVRFLEEVAQNEFILVRGELVTRREVPRALVFPDGTCRAVEVEIAVGRATRRIAVDPWTCAELLVPDRDGNWGGRR